MRSRLLQISSVFLFLCFCNIAFIQCRSGNDKEVIVVKDTTITPVTAITNLVLDSTFVESFINQESLEDSSARRLRNFYISRNYQYTWFTEDGLAEQAHTFWNLRNYYQRFNKDSSLMNAKLDEHMRLFSSDTLYTVSNNEKLQIELQLTRHFFQYAQYAYAGKIDPEELQWHIPRKKLDPVALLDSLVKNKNTDEWEPVNDQYTRLQVQLNRYAEIENTGGWKPLAIKKDATYKLNDTGKIIIDIKQRLFATGDLAVQDSSDIFDTSLVAAVKSAQFRFGIKQTGIFGGVLLKELNVPVKQRIEQILINMERMRWLPNPPGSTWILANIPEFKLHVFENNKEAWNMNIVVGTAGTSSVIFTDELKYIVFSPYWNVPSSITKSEIMPAMKKNPNYLASKNMEVTGYNNGIPVVRQRPGGSNALGAVKFIFPNSYNIYFHDTPSKSLFSRDKRAFSHGCIRLGEPFELAKYLLRSDTAWTDDSIRVAMNKNEEKWVTLKQSIPVFITYFTAWVDTEGKMHFRDDIYGHDEKMKERLFR